jgi:hypothetical protein
MSRSASRDGSRPRSGTSDVLPPTIERLADDLTGGQPADGITMDIRAWLGISPRFRDFAERYRDKIRKKLRSAADRDARLDVRAELRAAHLLLADRRIQLVFEGYGSQRAGPDFTVTIGGAAPFNVEVTRLRRVPDPMAIGTVVLAKLHQLPPSVANALVIAVDGNDASAVDAGGAVRNLRTRADRKDEAFFATHGFEGTKAFYERFLRLAAVLIWVDAADGDARVGPWVNRSARIAIPERALRACVSALRAA